MDVEQALLIPATEVRADHLNVNEGHVAGTSMQLAATMDVEQALPLPATEVRAGINHDILTVIAWQLDLENPVSVFSFLLVCKTARDALNPVLLHWYAKIHEFVEMANGDGPTEDDVPPQDLHITSWNQVNIHLTRHANFGQGDIEAFRWRDDQVSSDYCLALYYTYHVSQLEKRYDANAPVDEDERRLVHRKLHHTGLRLRNLFYFDEGEGGYREIKSLPGLKTVEMETSRVTLMEQVQSYVTKKYGEDALEQMLVQGLRHTTSPLEYRPHAYQLLKTTMKLHKPRSATLACQAVYQGQHLFRRCDAVNDLELRVFGGRRYNPKKKCAILDMRRTVNKRGRTLFKRVKELAPHPFPRLALDDEDDDY